ncbi:hypothetical protein SAMN02910298_01168 [Pseudobutyrivibrio sp. YE44]|uniref:hypothetical protein n=1 Tax=Pseudobutyrivibrio sp. YE44 TaxID=1520802 RepID=UPI000885F03C|nr:hypothetical protein [Pseudobutyrivibrio sp. YE44]SDB23686.1 hypothetical protein SAMN02910298_01168 [Pseudobutyrivibrio sp. YE44]
MNKKTWRNPFNRKEDNRAVAYEIDDQDLVGTSGGGVVTALRLTLAGRCCDDALTMASACCPPKKNY